LLAAIAAGIIAVVVATFARKYVVSGSLMSYLRLELGPHAGILGASALTVGYAGLITVYLSFGLYFMFGALSDLGMATPSTTIEVVACAVVLAACCVMQRRGVSFSVNIAIVLGLICAPLVVLILIAAMVHTGVDLSPQLKLAGFKLSAFVPVVAVAFGTYIGFEGLTALAVETKDPRRTVPFVLGALVAALAVAALASIVLTVPILQAHAASLNAGESPLRVLANIGGVGWAATPADLLVAIASLGGALAFINDSSRVVSTASRDGYLFKALGQLNAKHRTPAFAAQAMAAVSLVMIVIFEIATNQGMLGVVVNFTEFSVYAWSILYVAVTIAAAILAWRKRSLFTVTAYAITVMFLLALTIYQIYSGSGVTRVFTWLALGLIAAVFIASSLAYRRGARNLTVGPSGITVLAETPTPGANDAS
jgi:amino acid transporter